MSFDHAVSRLGWCVQNFRGYQKKILRDAFFEAFETYETGCAPVIQELNSGVRPERQLIHQIDGMVLPKFDMNSARDWRKAVASELMVMPTLETVMTFDQSAMRELRHLLLESAWEVLALRIGGNDLLACLGLRRPAQSTIYQTPLGSLIGQLVSTFSPHGFSLTAPVCEYFQNPKLLKKELSLDLTHGLVGKTVIHPKQINVVHGALKVSASDYVAAQSILAPDAPAVFKYEGAMLEPATHKAWALKICERAKYYGVI